MTEAQVKFIQANIDADLHRLLLSVLFNDRFESADSLYREFKQAYPDDPGCHLMDATIKMARMTYFEENIYPDYSKLLDTLQIKARTVFDSGSTETKSWMHLFIGHAKAYNSLWESRFGSLFSAVRLGMSAKSEYEDGLKLDSGIYDHYMGIGTYHYWKSVKAGMLRWMGVFKNDRALGIHELFLAADSAKIFGESARSGLIWVMMNEEKYDSAIVLAGEMQRKYPGGTSFLWPIAQAHFKNRDYEKVAETYGQIRTQIAGTPGNYYNLIECDYYISRCLEVSEGKDQAIEAAQKFALYEQNIPEKTKDRQKSRISYLRKLSEGKVFEQKTN